MAAERITVDRDVFAALFSAAKKLYEMTKRATYVPEMEHSYFKFETKSGNEYARLLHEYLVMAEKQASECEDEANGEAER